MHEHLHRKLKLSQHSHTGKRLPRHHTSYGVLLCMLLFTGFYLFTVGRMAEAESGDISLSGVMPGDPPTSPAVIESPTNEQKFTTSSTSVSGSCPADSFVQIFKNNIFAGSVQCISNRFSIAIELLEGANQLIAKVANNVGQYGPDSVPVNVTFTPSVSSGTSGGSALDAPQPAQLVVTSGSFYQGTLAGQDFILNLVIGGGTASYAVSVDWGDGRSSLLVRNAKGEFTTPHTYTAGGIYNLKVIVKDNDGKEASLKLVVLINGSPAAAGTTSEQPPPNTVPALAIIWPLYLIAIGSMLAFWLGEKFELYRLKHAHQLQPPAA